MDEHVTAQTYFIQSNAIYAQFNMYKNQKHQFNICVINHRKYLKRPGSIPV